ncbi:hypothetical protein BH23ACT2_BH23ACT2_03040 [soil metagenome]
MPHEPPLAPHRADHSDALAVDGASDLAIGWARRGDSVELEISGDHRSPPTSPELVADLARTVTAVLARPELDGASAHLAADHPSGSLDPLPEAVADATGFTDRRDLLQLRRGLPVEVDHQARDGAPALRTRAFRPGADESAWLRVNNRAFADHADQGHETTQTLDVRRAEPWFDANGFLVADDDGRPGELAGFCWTKVHPPTATEPELGEIYVIGVDPVHRGEGLGLSFVLAGLDHLTGRGIAIAGLFVDANNGPARRLYDRLGFAVHRRRRVYTS